MSTFLQRMWVIAALCVLPLTISADDYQLTNANFEDWSGAAFDGQQQPLGWNASNVEQVGFKFNFAHKESGHNGGYCMMVQDQSVGAMGVTETSPGYFSLGQPWAYVSSILEISKATAGCSGGISWTHRPDSMSVWIRRTGDNWDKEDFYLLYYAWEKQAKGSSYKGKNGSCTSHEEINEESDVRITMNGNECKTTVKGDQVCEGMWRERANYGNWTNIKVPIYYFNDNTPKYMNIIFSASNYPNFRANDGLYEGNSLYVDDVTLIYSSKIQTLRVGGKEWKGFDPNNTGVQVYSVAEGTTSIPTIEAFRGAGSLTNAHGTTKSFPGRKLQGSEITITNGTIGGTPTTIVVRAEDGSSTTTYQILFQAEQSSNAKLANITYTYTDIDGQQQTASIANFNPSTYNYTVELPYGSTGVPTVDVEKQEDEQTFTITQAASLTGKATVHVTAANGVGKATYNITFKVGLLADNTLRDILVNGKSIPGFTPSQAVYKVSLPTNTTTMPTVQAVSAYADGEQTITYKAPSVIDGGQYQVSVTTPGNQIAKVYKLNFKLEASSYTYLQNLSAGDYITNFEPTNTTYYVNMPLGTTALPAITWIKGDEYQTVSVTDLPEGALDGTVRITVTAGNGDQTVYKIVFSTEKSDRSTLNGILIGGTPIEGFSPDQTSYNYPLPVGTTELPTIEPVLGDEWQTYSITTAGLNGKTRITVTAGDGSTTIYQIAFSVATYTDNTLASLTVAGYDIAFAPETDEYYVNLPQGTTTLPEVTYVLKNETFQTASVRTITGLTGDYKITVRPQSGASRTYIIHFSLATSTNVTLNMIYVGGVAIENFDPETTAYEYHLPEGVSTIPAVTYDKAETSQRVLSVLEGKVQKITVTAESGAKREYTVTFIVQVSQNAFLEMIYLDGTALDGFRRDSLTYEVTLTGETCPVITVDKAAGQQVTITAPYAAGVATIKVQPEEGAANTYSITFVPVASETVRLQDLQIDGVSVDGFAPTKMSYEASYMTTRPTVTGIADNASQHVSTLWRGDVAWVYVSDEDGHQAAYSVTFTRIYSSEKALEAIYADGNLIDGFDAAVLNYEYTLPAGSAYPTITYLAKANTQVIFCGQMATGKYGITVAAEDGSKATYTVTYTLELHADATLQDLGIEGYDLNYSKTQNTYSGFVVPEGAVLPQVIAVPEEGQSVMIYTENDSTQHVLVQAESGAQNIYTIAYTRVKSNNVQLADILINGVSMDGFRPDKANYSISLTRETKVIPNINPVAQLDNQTITTYFCRPNGVARIHVMAQDGSEGEYTIAFPVEKSEDTQLQSLLIDGDSKDVNTTEYTFNVPFEQIEPYDVVYKAQAGQTVHYIEAPLTGETRIIVTNEKGTNSRTYSIRYNVAVPEGENKVKTISYSYTTASGATVNGELQPIPGENIVNLPFGCTAFEVTNVEKNYDKQTVYFYNGGIRRGATVIATSNRAGENDVTYTIVPQMPAFETTGKLQTLTFKGAEVPHFRPDVYNYIVNVTAQPSAADFAGTAYGNTTVTKSTLDTKKKQITLTVEGGETYSICWYYPEDEAPFTFNWVDTKIGHWYEVSTLGGIFGSQAKDKGQASNSTGYKPQGWSVPADLFAYIDYDATVSHFTYYTGKEVNRISDKEVLLSTIRGGALNSSVPGVMTLGEVQLSNGVALNGNTTFKYVKDLSKYKTYRNTPEQFAFDYQPLMTINGINTWTAWVSIGTDNNTKVAYDMSGDYSNLGQWRTKTQNLTYNFTVQRMNVMICASESSGQNLEIYAGGTAKSSDLQIRNIRFVYNSELTGVTVNGKTTTKDGNTFTYNVPDNEVIMGLPELKFTKKVVDQTQTIEWLHNGEWLNGELTAKVVNYGENAKDSTVYTVVLKRTPVTTLDYTAEFGSYTTTEKGDTVFVALPYGTKQLPNMTITPQSVHQLITMSKNGNAVTVNVTAEDESHKTTVYVFQETKSNDATPELWSLESGVLNTVDADNLIYSVEATTMPIVEITKKEGQLIDINYTVDGAVFTVTAADGKTQQTYTINRLDPTITTTGQIDEFTKGTTPWSALGGDTYAATDAKPTQAILFERKFDQDSVVYVQAPDHMEWQVYGTVNHTYVLTYPTAKSSNAFLGSLLINGLPYADFSATDLQYTIEMEGDFIIEAVEEEPAQTIVMTQAASAGEVVVYTAVVTAEDGVTTKTYGVTIRRPKSNNATLAGILLNNVALDGFAPNIFDYTVEMPVPAVKTVQPTMPSITYLVGNEEQRVTVTPGELNGSATELFVQAGDNSNNTYTITITAAKSACADLTGITVNGVLVEQFEPGRHFYSQSLNVSTVEVNYTADDQFLTVTTGIDTVKPDHQYRYTLHVEAENGNNVDYEVMIYVENQSNDAQLANILLNGQNMNDFERALNADLSFDAGNNNYEIHLPSGTTVLPEVSAQLKMDGQTVDILHHQDSILLDVYAVDGTLNTYTLKFIVPMSKNADLSMIFLDGDSLAGFEPTYYFYQVDLPVGVHTMPEVAAQKGEAGQVISSIEIDTDKLQATIKVQAEDPSVRENTYVVVFHLTQSDADQLNMIYQDGQPLDGFVPTTMYYAFSLPVGTTAFPDLSWQEQDDWQTIQMDTVEQSQNTLIRQIYVTSESGKKNTYTVSYTIDKSDVDYLQMIFVDQKQLANFEPTNTTYYVTLTAAYAAELNGQMPNVEYIAGDDYQNVLISQMPEDSLSSKSLGYKSIITVTAATGKTRLYTIHYPVELSTVSTLNMINLGGKPLTNFDSERFNYKVEIEQEASVPVVSVIKKEEAQVYEIQVVEDTVLINVTAEDINYESTYKLTFERLKSANTQLRDIVLTDAEGTVFSFSQFPFRSEVYSYIVNLPYSQDATVEEQLPTIDPVYYDEEQRSETVLHVLANGDIQADVTVTAANGEDQAIYSITFHFVKPADAMLASLSLNGEEFADFRPTKTEYTYAHPFGTDPSAYFTQDDVTYVLSDSLATATISTSEDGMISIVVVAQDGYTSITYLISQTTAPDGDNTLAWITVDGNLISGFDPEVNFYTYYLFEGGAVPEIDAAPHSENAEVDLGRVVVGDTCTIICTAADGTDRYYYIDFAISDIKPGDPATSSDVLIKRVPGSYQILAATVRQGVTFALYDQYGHMMYYGRVPVADPNDAQIIQGADQHQHLNDVTDTKSGLLVNIIPGQPYLYCFFADEKTILQSGKLMAR